MFSKLSPLLFDNNRLEGNTSRRFLLVPAKLDYKNQHSQSAAPDLLKIVLIIFETAQGIIGGRSKVIIRFFPACRSTGFGIS